MRNLFERLKPEYIQKLKESEILYPCSIPAIIKSLEENNFWSDLTYSQVIIFLDHLDIYDLSPSTIQNLFEND